MFTKEQITNNVFSGDCLEIMPMIPDKCIDLILCDLPYAATHNQWDSIIPFPKLWEQYKRIIKDNGAILLYASGKFAYHVMNSNPQWYKYDWVWLKNNVTNFPNAKKQPLRKHEQILVFYKKQPTYHPQGLMELTTPRKRQHSDDKIGESFRCAALDRPFIQTHSNYPNALLKFDRDKDCFHPTQKPIALNEYLINTYSNPGDLVLDNCAGAGSTLLAAINTGRNYCGIEKEERYYQIINDRLNTNLL